VFCSLKNRFPKEKGKKESMETATPGWGPKESGINGGLL
jgi:hypothetical protein